MHHLYKYSFCSFYFLRSAAAPASAFSRDGDSGYSKTLSLKVIPKDSHIFQAIGVTEELVSYIGLAREHALEGDHEYTDKLKRIQTVIIDLSTAISRSGDEFSKIVSKAYTRELEDWIEEYSKLLPPPEQYIIPVSKIFFRILN